MKKIPLILNKLIYFKEEKIGFVCVAVNGRSEFYVEIYMLLKQDRTEKDDF